MALNTFFNNHESYEEQSLVESLVNESIKMYGYDVWYLPRTLKSKDEIYGEDTISEYNDKYMIEMYIKNVEGFEGEGDFLSKFNLQIRDEITFTVSKSRYAQEIGHQEAFTRPREGDLIYFPLNGKIFNIKFVEHEVPFYQLGSLYTYDLRCELFEYSNEKFNTSIDEIDAIETQHSLALDVTKDANNNVTLDTNGRPTIDEDYDFDTAAGDGLTDNSELETAGDSILDWTTTDPFSDGNV